MQSAKPLSVKSLNVLINLVILLLAQLPLATSAWAASAKLWFNPGTGDKTVNQTFDVTIQLDTNGASTDGTRAIVNYDPDKLEVLDLKNGVYNSYPTKKWEGGQITISGIAALDGPFYAGTDTFATITFKPKATGKTDLTFVFTAGSTTDSNVAEHGTNNDILGSVGNAEFNIVNSASSGDSGNSGGGSSGGGNSGSGSDASSGGGASTGGPGPDQTTTNLPNSGVTGATWTLAAIGLLLFGSGSLLLRRNY